MMNKEALELVFLHFFHLLKIIPLLLHTVNYTKVLDHSDQAAHYHNLGIYVWSIISDQALGRVQSEEFNFYF